MANAKSKVEAKKAESKIDIGISEKHRKQIAERLSALLADNYTLYLKTHAFHWNVTGPMFNSLHVMFEVQYNELWLANDVIAETMQVTVSERGATRMDDRTSEASMERRKKEGYF